VHSDLTYTATPQTPEPAIRAQDPSLAPVSATNTVREWLDHPVGGVLLRAALGGPNFDEEVLQPAFGLPLRQLVALSGGRFPQSTLDDLLTKVGGGAAPQDAQQS
jgi:hypothetical protein